MLRGGELTPILQAFEYAPVRLNMSADVSEHAVNRKLRTIRPGLLVPLSQHDTRRIVWERGACLFLKRWGAYPKRWCSGRWSYSCSIPRQVVRGYLWKKNRERGIREPYRDLAHVIHQCFCYNRPNRPEQCGLLLSARIHYRCDCMGSLARTK